MAEGSRSIVPNHNLLVGKEPLPKLRAWIKEYFSSIPPRLAHDRSFFQTRHISSLLLFMDIRFFDLKCLVRDSALESIVVPRDVCESGL